MHFAFDEQQQAFRTQLRTYAERECTPADVRAAWDTPTGWSPTRWAALADMGVVGLTVPAAFGGLGLGLVDLVALMEEAGRAALPEPLLDTTGLAVPLLAAAPHDDAGALRDALLPEIAAGRVVVGVCGPGTDATSTAAADVFVVGGADGIYAVRRDAATLETAAALDGTRRPAVVGWDPARSTCLATPPDAARLAQSLTARAAAMAAALLLGLGDKMVAMAAAYAVERRQFGQPIGSFQAVKHLLADALVGLEFARPVVYRAAWALDEGSPDAARDASMAKACASEAAVAAARSALQVHGAIGYTWECDLHLWMKRAWALAADWGDAADHRARVLDSLLDG